MARPRLVSQGRTFEVVDISEQGVKFVFDAVSAVLTVAMDGIVYLRDGEKLPINGIVARVEQNMAALRLFKDIPYKQIHKEELFLIRKYPNRNSSL